ncbi:unnamed protein product [Victoria cruziana]
MPTRSSTADIIFGWTELKNS